MSNLEKEKYLREQIYKHFDEHGIAYKYNSGIGINLDFFNEFDEIERLVNGLNSLEEATNIDNWFKFSKMEFIIPMIFRNQIRSSNGINYPDLVSDYMRNTFELLSSELLIDDFRSIGLLNITSYHGVSLSNSKLHYSNWGHELTGIITFPRKLVIGDISVDKFGINEKIEVIDGNLMINCEIDNFGNLTNIYGNLKFSSNITQNKLKSVFPLKIINGNCFLKNTRLILDSIEQIKGDLNIRKCLIKSINPDIIIHGNLLISKYNYIAIEENIKQLTIKGRIKKYSDPFDIRFNDDDWLQNLINNLY